ncbi:unnamed protein product [Scytosiphon promiscuus]
MKVMDLLTEHKTAGLVGEDRVSQLRDSLVDARELLRAETYGGSAAGNAAVTAPPPTPPPPPMPSSPPPPPSPPSPRSPPPPRQQQQQQPPPATSMTAISPANAETLRRCSALLQAHVHSSLAGGDLQALVEGLTSSLSIVTAQLVAGTTAAGSGGAVGGGGSGQGGAEAAARGGDAEVPAYVGGVQSVGGVLSDMGVGNKPASFMPESEEGEGGGGGWTDGSLGKEEKAVATKALGYLLKHRGGKGYGRGRVKGAEAEAMVAALAEVTEIMHDEMVEE